jgi:hypothetical protein
LYVNGSNGLVLGPSDAAVIDSSGNLGIGSTSPDQKLVVRDVNKIVDGIGNVFFATTDSQAADLGASLSLGGTYVGTSAYSFAAIAGRKTNSTSTDASGYLAMYTTNPSNTIVERARITSGGDFYLGPLATNFTFTNGSAVSLAGSGTGIAGNGTNLTLGAWNGPIIFQVGNSAGALVERARIDTSGNLLVGSTNSSGTIGAGFKVLGGRPVVVNADSANATTVYEAYSTGASAYRFYVGMGGTIYATSTTITPITSDERLKQNIVDYSNGLSQVLGLRPRYFEYKKEPGRKLAGFISQEVQTVMPEAIVPTLEDPEMMTYSIDWYPLFVKAIQEQQALITQLTARITALESA